jgi:hypothetical protein
MSRLDFIGRPWVAFDESNRQHRQWFAEFQETRTWGHCPVRFIVSDDHGDLLTMIQRRLITYYTNKEFGKIDGCVPRFKAVQ